MRPGIALGVSLGVLVGCAVAAVYYVHQQMRIRIVQKVEGGVWMAVNIEGLRELNVLYAPPKLCGDPAFRKKTDPVAYLELCMKAVVPVKSEMINKGMVLLPAGARATSIETRYVFEDGRLAPRSYSPRNPNDSIADGSVEVEHVRLTEPSGVKLDGWVRRGYLYVTFGPFP